MNGILNTLPFLVRVLDTFHTMFNPFLMDKISLNAKVDTPLFAVDAVTAAATL